MANHKNMSLLLEYGILEIKTSKFKGFLYFKRSAFIIFRFLNFDCRVLISLYNLSSTSKDFTNLAFLHKYGISIPFPVPISQTSSKGFISDISIIFLATLKSVRKFCP